MADQLALYKHGKGFHQRFSPATSVIQVPLPNHSVSRDLIFRRELQSSWNRHAPTEANV